MPVLKTRIHELRKERKMQQSDLAELVGVRRETIGNLENGKIQSLTQAGYGYRQVFGKPVEYIFQFEEEDK